MSPHRPSSPLRPSSPQSGVFRCPACHASYSTRPGLDTHFHSEPGHYFAAVTIHNAPPFPNTITRRITRRGNETIITVHP